MRLVVSITCCLALLISNLTFGQVGQVIWEENFNTLDNWVIAEGNGSWGWGNGELQYYQPDNVRIDEVPGDPGNNALFITAKAESGATIVDQWGNPLNYTSGRLHTLSKVSVKYGMIETRVQVPDLDLGGWPAVWLLGTTNYGWPSKGEIDMMEMGQAKWFRDLHDGHNGGNNQDNSTVNEMVGSNAIFYSEASINPQNPAGAASLAWDPNDEFVRPYYNHTDPLAGRFLTYRTYWDENSIRFTVIDDGTEYDLYTTEFGITEESAEFQDPFYLLANFAIGGNFTDAYSLGDPASGAPVSMGLPAEMMVDYIKIFEWNGQGEVHLGPPTTQYGRCVLFSDETERESELIPDSTSQIYVWEETLIPGTIEPYEGTNVLSWQTNAKGWFGAGILAVQPMNVFEYAEGNLSFRIKIPADVTFKIGITDVWGNQNYLEFPANQTTYGLQRDGEWGQAVIPVSDIRGTFMDLRMLAYSFVILEENGANAEFALDDIYWEGGPDRPALSAPSPIEETFQLTAYPNPSNTAATIAYQLPVNSEVEILIYDLQGRIADRLVNARQPAGLHQVNWDVTGVAAGIYSYTLKTNDAIVTRKLVVQH